MEITCLYYTFVGSCKRFVYLRVGQNCAPSVQTTNFSVTLKRCVNLIDNDFSKLQKNR